MKFIQTNFEITIQTFYDTESPKEGSNCFAGTYHSVLNNFDRIRKKNILTKGK